MPGFFFCGFESQSTASRMNVRGPRGVPPQAVEMNIGIGRRCKALYQHHGTGCGFGTLESRLLDQKFRYDSVDDLQDGREQVGM